MVEVLAILANFPLRNWPEKIVNHTNWLEKDSMGINDSDRFFKLLQNVCIKLGETRNPLLC